VTTQQASIDTSHQAPAAPLISYVVLNWRNEAETTACVASIVAQRSPVPCEILVVDNQSTEVSRQALSRADWRLVCLSANAGYAGGMNAGAAHARGEFLALLNNDVRLDPEWCERALAAMDDDRIAIVGGRDEHTTVPRVSPRGFPELTSLELPPTKVGAVDGGHLLIRRSAWLEVGGFDQDFFAYYDELDLCARLLARGYEVLYEPRLRVHHARGTSSDRVRWKRIYWARRNRTIWLAKHFPSGEWREAVLAAALEYAAYALRPRVGPRARRDRLSAVSAALASCLWVLTHGRWLRRKRRETIARGLHAESYRSYLAEVYERMHGPEPATAD
jgi:GT2 family glycosyltransferase